MLDFFYAQPFLVNLEKTNPFFLKAIGKKLPEI
jgi:hypothetical protein